MPGQPHHLWSDAKDAVELPGAIATPRPCRRGGRCHERLDQRDRCARRDRGWLGGLAAPGRGEAVAEAAAGSPADAEFYSSQQWNLKAIRAKAGWPVEPVPATPADESSSRSWIPGSTTCTDLGIRRNADGSAGDGGLVDLDKSTSLITEVPAGTTCVGEPGCRIARTAHEIPSTRSPRRRLVAASRTDFHSHGTWFRPDREPRSGWRAYPTDDAVRREGAWHGPHELPQRPGRHQYAADEARTSSISASRSSSMSSIRVLGAVDTINDALDYAHAMERSSSPPRKRTCRQSAVEPRRGHDFGSAKAITSSACRPTEPIRRILSKSRTGTRSRVQQLREFDRRRRTRRHRAVPVWLTSPGDAVQRRAAGAVPSRRSDVDEHGHELRGGRDLRAGRPPEGPRPGRDADPIEALIEDSAVDLGVQGFDVRFGEGRIDVKRAVRLVMP